jgi:hypothetical protein
VAAEQDFPLGAAPERVPVVPGGVAFDLEWEVAEALGEPGTRDRPGLRPRDALGAVLGPRERTELLEVRDDTRRIERHRPELNPLRRPPVW